jgi:hypothetical protein
MTDGERETLRQFRDAVNMAPADLERWLESAESKEVGYKASGGESVGHQSGRRIVDLLRTKQADYTADDFAHMRRVVGYVHRHMAQRPEKSAAELAHTRWRWSLMNWGHDPLKKGG